ncbi:MAG: alpha/beta fold hydrolase [Gammaproteobacteria bacterium]|nr:alpha/beta fold hydrolase [Gammaproteobacteria bacterium]
MTCPARLVRLAAGVLLGWGAAARAPAAGLALSDCVLEHPLKLIAVNAQCAQLEVPEDYAAPAGTHLALRVARIGAISRRKSPEPLFVLAGGPGQGAADLYTSVLPAFGRIHRERDIVLLDQRGTGASQRLNCPEEEEELDESTPEAVRALTARCLASLAPRARVAYYTTSLAVRDLDRARAALGYERIDLYGASYGTRVAQHYLRRYPQRVAAVILDGVVPVEMAMGPATALDAEAALGQILRRCASEPACRSRFDAAADYRAVRAELAAHAVQVSATDPAGGAARALAFGPEQLATVLRLASYASDYAALLPLWLHGAHATHDYGPLAAQYLLLERSYGGLAVGMHHSVVCAEDVPFYGSVARGPLAATYMGARQLDALEAVCRVWPRGPVDEDLHAPLHSSVPALLLSGGADPVTPPQYAHQAARGFAHAQEIVLEGFGHGQLTVPCMDRVMASFLDAPAAALDISCTARARPMPFFTSVNGPAP